MLKNEEAEKGDLDSKEIVEESRKKVITENAVTAENGDFDAEINSSKDNEPNKKETSKTKTKVDEEKVIEKIKSFIAKIVAMQEEARKEEKQEKEQKKEDKIAIKDNTEKNDYSNKANYMLEYYDLPYRYNETVVKILAQTPKRLFVYWDIADSDREKYIRTFGDDFFEKTYPILLVYNEDMKYVKEVPINDFANSWYIDVQDPKTRYTIQLGRKFKQYPTNIDMRKIEENSIILRTDYLPFANSNILEAPNDHVLLEYLPRFITFRNVKTNKEYIKDIKGLKNVFGKNYKVKEFYKENYKEELKEGIFDMANPSSKLSSSTFK